MITVIFDQSENAKPLYIQLYEHIRNEILAKRIVAGQKLPSKVKLSTHLGVSVKTIENAYFQLALEGYIYSKEKVGYFASHIEGFRTEGRSKPGTYTSKYEPTEYQLDIKDNSTPTHLFPLSVWTRLGREVFSEQGEKLLETVPFNGIPELRIAIAKHLADFKGMTVSPDQIIIGSGTEYLYQRITHLLGANCVIGMENPGYSHIQKILMNDNVTHRNIPMDKYGIRPDLLAKSDCTALHISPQLHFPLGITVPVQRRIELFRWLNDAPGRYLIEDDYCSEFLYQGSPVPTMFTTDVMGKVIYLNTFSKTVMPSVRVAYMVLPEQLMEKYLETMSFYSCTVSSAQQYQLAKFISGGHMERFIHRTRQHNLEQRKMILHTLSRSELRNRITARPFSSGTHLLLELNTEKSDASIREDLLSEGVLASFVSEYCETQSEPDMLEDEFEHKLILNYSRITEEEMRWLIELLQKHCFSPA